MKDIKTDSLILIVILSVFLPILLVIYKAVSTDWSGVVGKPIFTLVCLWLVAFVSIWVVYLLAFLIFWLTRKVCVWVVLFFEGEKSVD